MKKKKPAVQKVVTQMISVVKAEIVEVQLSMNVKGRKTIWVNVDGVCRLRVGSIENIVIK